MGIGSHLFEEILPEHLLEFAPDAIVGATPDGRIVLVNAQTERTFGYSRDELLGEQVEKLIPERFRDQHVGHREGYFANPGIRPMGSGLEFYGLRSDGTEFPADIAASSIKTGSGEVALAIVRDLSDVRADEHRKEEEITRAKREAQIAQSSRLESLGQLAGGVAHDFNNLLGVILNYADFVAEELEEGSSAHTDVVEIKKAAEKATQLTRQLLIFSRREIVKPAPVDLNAVVTDIERLLRRTLGEHVELVVDFEEDLPAVHADPGQLEQVLVNLAINARDAMPEGGRLHVETSAVELDEEFLRQHPNAEPGPYVRLTVADTGCGMEPDVVSRAFEPFFSTKRRGEGTGLGLATVYGIVTGAGGQIGIYSELGEGTAFRVHLPAVEAKAVADAEEPSRTNLRGHGERILVVEDEDSVRTLATRLLTEGGYRVRAASRGQEALELLGDQDQEFELLLSDVVMPEMRGVELVRRTHELRPNLPVLMMSGYTTPIVEEERQAMANAPLIEKPFSGRALLEEVHALLDGRGED